MKNIAILGSTGSIGTQALLVCEQLGIKITALSARQNAGLLENQARKYHPKIVVMTNEAAAATLKTALADTNIRVLSGTEALCEAAALPESDMVLNSVMGMVGLPPTLAALKAKKPVALANKETLVAAGELVMKTANDNSTAIIPVDSEHSAIFQCLCGNAKNEVRRIILTASGGPFFGKTRAELKSVTLRQALCHPSWSMGKKITVDSATLMNKGLELIEAVWLFGVSPDMIDVHVHRESILHSAVEFCDGAVIAQLGTADMALPIRYALCYPHRSKSTLPPLDLFAVGALTFSPPDCETFRALPLARATIERGGLSPCILNAANEAAVGLFLEEKIGFLDIERLVEGALEHLPAGGYTQLSEVLECERAAREYVAARAE